MISATAERYLALPPSAVQPAATEGSSGGDGGGGGSGWTAGAVVHFLSSGRDWAAVDAFYRRLVAGEVAIESLGLSLLETGPPAAAAVAVAAAAVRMPPPRPAAEASEQAEPQAPAVASDPAAAAAAAGAAGAAAAAAPPAAADVAVSLQQLQTRRNRPPHLRSTFKVHISYYGPAFRGWQWVKQEHATLEEGIRTTLHLLLYGGGSSSDGDSAAGAAATDPASSGGAPAAAAGAGLGSSDSHADTVAGVSSSTPDVATSTASGSRGNGKTSGKGSGGPGSVVLSVAGRTDKGVHALGQVFSFYTWNDAILPQHVLQAVCSVQPGLLRAWHVEAAPRSFHATFGAQWRRYLYLLPLRTPAAAAAATAAATTAAAAASGAGITASSSSDADVSRDGIDGSGGGGDADDGCGTSSGGELLDWFDAAAVDGAADVDPARVAALLQQLEGRELDYTAFARGTPAGKGCNCTLLRARAWRCCLPDAQQTPVLAVELIGDRFLRRMVRVLVATAVREAVPEAAWFPEAAAAAAGAAAAVAPEAAAVVGAKQEATPAAAVVATRPPAAAGAPEAAGQPCFDAAALLLVAASRSRRHSASAAPSGGLCFLEVGYSPYQPASQPLTG